MEPLEGGHYNSDSCRVLTTIPLPTLFSKAFRLHSIIFFLFPFISPYLVWIWGFDELLVEWEKEGADALYLINKSIRKAFCLKNGNGFWKFLEYSAFCDKLISLFRKRGRGKKYIKNPPFAG